MRKRIATLAVGSATALTLGVGMSTPAHAANSANQNGLINLALQDTVVQVPVGLAANICGVSANVLTAAALTSPVTCTATGVSTATAPPSSGNNSANQNGLVNVAVQQTTVQVPVAVAANVCGVAVNVVATFVATGPVTCTALTNAAAV